jgi:hypothetical protein
MKSSKKRFVFILSFSLTVVFLSCKKEEKAVPLTPRIVTNFDAGHIKIRISGTSGAVDSIKYFNFTKGVTSTFAVSGFQYDLPNNRSVLYLPQLSGNTNDQLQCCVYLNLPTAVGISFEDIHVDSIPTTVSNVWICEDGNY